MCFNPYTGQFTAFKEECNSESGIEIESRPFQGFNFTISGFNKPVFESAKSSDFLENRIQKFQKDIFDKAEKEKKEERDPSEFNIVEKLMFNV